MMTECCGASAAAIRMPALHEGVVRDVDRAARERWHTGAFLGIRGVKTPESRESESEI